MHMSLASTIEANAGFRLEHDGYSRSYKGLKAERKFVPPGALRLGDDCTVDLDMWFHSVCQSLQHR